MNRNRSVVLIPDRVYRIETRYGDSSQCVDQLTLSVADGRTADLIGRTLDAAFDDGMSDEQARAEVFEALRYEYNNVIKSPCRDRLAGYLADLDRAMDIFTPPATSERLAELGRHVAEMAGAR